VYPVGGPPRIIGHPIVYFKVHGGALKRKPSKYPTSPK
jgi:hypothetical protein